MLSVLLLCLAMFSAAWAYASMMRSGEFGFGDMPVKYRVFLIMYALVALFTLWGGGPVIFLAYVAIACVGAACGWFLTKEGTVKRDGGLRVPVRMQVMPGGSTGTGKHAGDADSTSSPHSLTGNADSAAPDDASGTDGKATADGGGNGNGNG